jgi:carboxyl-terminal processing protease
LRRGLWISAAVLAAAGVFALGLATARPSAHEHATAFAPGSATLVDQVRERLIQRYYRVVPPQVLHEPSIDRIIAALGDPYTAYLDPSAYRLLRQETSAVYSGVGMSVLPARNGLLVASEQSGPAREAGIRPGDVVLSVDRVPVAPLSFDAALGRILGPSGTNVRLTVLHDGRVVVYSVVRRRLAAPSVSTRLLVSGGRRIGYLRLSAFRIGAAQVLRQALQRLQNEHVTGLVLDLRANPGGFLDQAVAVASLFLDRGVVVSIEGAHQARHVYSVSGKPGTRLPVVVLVDRVTASSAEVVAAALHEHGRARLVGERTFGKALVQSVVPLANGAALKLTTAHYLTPGGLDISRNGVVPDVLAADDPHTPRDEGLDAALRALLSS